MLLPSTLSTAIALLALSAEAAKPRDAILLSKVRTYLFTLPHTPHPSPPPHTHTPNLPTADPHASPRLKQVESLTLRSSQQTSHRRVPAVPQLRCISRPALCAKHEVDLMRCDNKGAGYDAEDIQWTCAAQLPPELKLGSTDVQCEGYSGPDDPYVLKGSCGVEYRLVLTRAGEERWPDLAGGRDHDHHPHGGGPGDTWFAYLFWVLFVGVVGWIAYSAWRESQQARRGGGGGGGPRRAPRRNNGGGGGWGGGGDDGWDDPPPPYPGSGGGGYARGKTGARGGGGGSGGSNWQSNVLSGAAGAAAGYFAGSRGRNNGNNASGGGYEGGGRSYGSTWGGSGAGPSRSGSSGSSSGSAASNSRYESTGFGSTSRR